MSTQANKDLIYRFVEAFNRKDAQGAAALVSEDWTNYDANLPPLPHGPEGAHQLITLFAQGIPDLQLVVEAMIAEGDLVASRWTCHGTQTGEFLGIPATGRSATVTATAVFRVTNGKIAENRVNFDAFGLMVQLGVIPAPGQPAQTI